ncbi:MAG TPA: Fic family protein, partial [Chloroflexota bacterium]|nr:Fic family protein [Chloroflexota bacterium]
GAVVQAVSRAEAAISKLEHLPGGFPTTRQLASLEALGSGRLSGLTTTPRRLAEVLGRHNRRDVTAQQIAHLVVATETAAANDQGPITPDRLDSINGAVLGIEGSRLSVRTRQVWAGTSRTPRAAEFVPAPPNSVMNLVDDLCAFLARTDLPPIAHAAIAHAQFLAICPYYDGNGRTARSLIQALLRHHCPTSGIIPISPILAMNRRSYIDQLAAYRDGEVIGYCAAFAASVETAALHASGLAADCEGTLSQSRKQLGRVRSGSTADRLLPLLFDCPVVNTKDVQQALGVSDEAARLGLMALENAGVVRRLGGSPYDRTWIADVALDLLERWEYGIELE